MAYIKDIFFERKIYDLKKNLFQIQSFGLNLFIPIVGGWDWSWSIGKNKSWFECQSYSWSEYMDKSKCWSYIM